MKTTSFTSVFAIVILLFSTSCLYDANIEPTTPEFFDIKSSDLVIENGININKNLVVLYIDYEKGKGKLEVNRNQATLNFDNNDPRIVRVQAKEKLNNLKNFRAENNLLKEIPEFALQQGIKRINVSNNRITKLPVFKKNTSLIHLDLSYNKLEVKIDELRKMALPKGSILNLTKTGIPCKYVHDYIKHYPEVEVIHDCKLIIKEPIKEIVK